MCWSGPQGTAGESGALAAELAWVSSSTDQLDGGGLIWSPQASVLICRMGESGEQAAGHQVLSTSAGEHHHREQPGASPPTCLQLRYLNAPLVSPSPPWQVSKCGASGGLVQSPRAHVLQAQADECSPRLEHQQSWP